ncbi:MAG: ribosome maturation factor RimP [Actinomycetes bacterium]|nr:ribosome maturation factor RimP [Actinomycetota bacterium]
MSLVEIIQEALTPVVESAGFFLEEVHIASPSNRRVVTCIVDGEISLNLDQVTLVSKEISAILDEAPFMGQTPFTLEVTSPGVDRPLTLPRHWRKNLSRLVRIVLLSGEVVTGRIAASNESTVTLLIEEKVSREEIVNYADIKKALVEIEFNRKGDDL